MAVFTRAIPTNVLAIMVNFPTPSRNLPQSSKSQFIPRTDVPIKATAPVICTKDFDSCSISSMTFFMVASWSFCMELAIPLISRLKELILFRKETAD